MVFNVVSCVFCDLNSVFCGLCFVFCVLCYVFCAHCSVLSAQYHILMCCVLCALCSLCSQTQCPISHTDVLGGRSPHGNDLLSRSLSTRHHFIRIIIIAAIIMVTITLTVILKQKHGRCKIVKERDVCQTPCQKDKTNLHKEKEST